MSIYKDLILDHYKNPRYRGELKKYTIKKVSINPSCGDQITFYILIKDNVIKEVSYTSTGCVISQAAASTHQHHSFRYQKNKFSSLNFLEIPDYSLCYQ